MHARIAEIVETRNSVSRQRRRPSGRASDPGMAGLHSGSGSLLTESPAPQPAPMSGQSAGQIPSTLLKKALCIRRTEERLLELYSQGKISGTVHTCIGQEWVGVAVAAHLGPGDYLFSNHRGHGHYLAFTDDVEGLLAEVMGRVTGVCGG